MTLSNLSQSSPLSNYNRSQTDKTFADADETLLGHLVLEQGLTLQDALENLRPHVKQARTATELATDWTGKIGFGSIAVGVLLGTSIGAPLAIPPLLAGCLSLKFWGDSRNEKPRRDAEYRLLRDVVPQLPEFLWGLHLKGCSAMEIIGAYDGLVSAIESAIESGKTVEEQDVSAYLWHKIEASRGFQATLTQGQDRDGEPEKLPQTQLEQPKDQDASPQQQAESLAPSAVQQAVKPSYAQTGDDIARSLAEKVQSTLIVGQPGAGKGMLIAMATREVKRLHPDIEIWAIDPKADPQERDYWQAVDLYLPIPISPFTRSEDMDYICDRIDGFISDFQASSKPKLLIFDEALAAREKAPKWFKGLMSGFNALCSMGRSRRQYGWLVSQSPNTDDFGISGGVRNVYRRILLLSQDNLGLLDNGSTYFSGKPNRMLLEKTGRVFFDSTINGWGSVPRYSIPSSPVAPIENPQPEPMPAGESRREQLEKIFLGSPSLETEPAPIDEADPMIELLESEPDPQMRKALLIGYRWARSRISEGKEVTKEAFLNRAKNERKCDYLRENRNDVWDMLDGLIF